MIEPLLRRFLVYEKRKQVVIIGTILTGLVVVWPATDEYIAARQQTQESQLAVEEAEHAIAKRPQYAQLHQRKTQELDVLAQRLVGDQAARKLQSDVTELGRKTGCTVLRAQLTDPATRTWNQNDHPVAGTSLKNTGGETPFQLETRQLSLSVTGPMSGLYAFLEGLHRVEKVIHPRAMSIKGGDSMSGNDQDTGTLDLQLLLFDLTKREIVVES
ncbi:MAG: hypothetical protein H6822_28200 [Planctomycetaceae bacterium]|nr:hypothetical protein [Planctomycetales bacterium]MCB9926064.1 hypothetical protein [Planctomycetaceae bacterium]